MLFKKEKDYGGTYDFLIAGLGNPDTKYEMTRHNAGFLAADMLAMKYDVKMKKLKFHALIGDANIEGKRCLLMKPQTYMNNSGEAVGAASAFYKIPPQNIIIFSDDVLLDVGKIRVRRKGSDGGHNGLKSIINHLHSSDFPRVRIGVGKMPSPETDMIEWVLSRFPKEDEEPLRAALQNAVDAAVMITKGEIDRSMNLYN